MENSLLKCGKTTLVGFGTMMVGRAVTMYLDRGVRQSGLTISQIYAMFLVDKFRGQHMVVIARKGIMHRTTLTRVLSGISQYVVIHKNNIIDARHSYPALTKKGADFLEEWMPKVIELEQGLEISAGNSEEFIKFIDFFSDNLVSLNKNNMTILE